LYLVILSDIAGLADIGRKSVELFTKKKWKSLVSLLAILLHTDYLLVVYQPPILE
jgi:hypothetical protein